MKKKLLDSAPWRDEEKIEKFADAKLRATHQPGVTHTTYVPRKKSASSKAHKDDDSIEIDPELRYSFQRNVQFLRRVFSIDTIVKPLPPALAYNISRNLSFFTRIFTQFFAYIAAAPIVGIPGSLQLLITWLEDPRITLGFSKLAEVTVWIDPEGISNAQKSLGLGQEEKVRRVR